MNPKMLLFPFSHRKNDEANPLPPKRLAYFLLLSALTLLLVTISQASTGTLSEGTDTGWLAKVEKELADLEYHASDTTKGLQAPNRVHNLRTYFSSAGISLVERTGEMDSELFQMHLAGMGRGSGISPFARTAEISFTDNRVELRHEGISEWYVNGPEGLEQGFTVFQRPAGTGPLTLSLSVLGAETRLQGEKILLVTRSGRKLEYGKLYVSDARGRGIDASMAPSAEGMIRITVQDMLAEYPLVIDPLISSPADAMVESNQEGAMMGHSVSGAGDVNGDGYDDVIVGVFRYDHGQENEGAAFIYHGSASGISTTYAAMVESNQVEAEMGYSVSGAGDVNGDGYDDVVIGAWLYDNGQTGEGAAFIYHGSASGVSSTYAAMVESNQTAAYMGVSVSGAGDVNGDGYDDVIVGAYCYNNGEALEGAAFVYHGSDSGISTTYATMVESNQISAYMGESVSGAGDVNGDGYDDVIVGDAWYDNGQTGEGAAFIYHGSASGVSSTYAAMVESNQVSACMGQSVSGAGDVDNDGYSDVIVGAAYYNNDDGAAFIYYGSASGIGTTNASMIESNQTDSHMGRSVSGAGDVNGDGYDDVIVGANSYYDDNAELWEGAAFIYHGSASGIGTSHAAIVESNQFDAGMGWSVSGAGDVNGDGYDDVIVGAIYYDNDETNEGAAFIYHGGASGIGTPDEYNLNVLIFGKGVGGVTSEPTGIQCNDDCDELYEYNTKVELTAKPQKGSRFIGWTGDCTGRNPVCNLNIDSTKNVGAEFYYFPWLMFIPALQGNPF